MAQEFQYPPGYDRSLDTSPPPKESFKDELAAELKTQFGVTRLGLYKAWVKISRWVDRIFIGFFAGLIIGTGGVFFAYRVSTLDQIDPFMSLAVGYLIGLTILLFIAKQIVVAFVPAELLLRKEDGIVELEDQWVHRFPKKRSRRNRKSEPVVESK